ncbi:GNAT family N-acetyltransferase [uncultured Roseobacter sp.]|uniref:GNAT family N-acetyltransferase n=1 Tax=uncultured Roseobacter sp. TaxID=114847 RepID=UPI00262F193E|nr:N-acetyltransferase [uncultured Roseobacter sp.]
MASAPDAQTTIIRPYISSDWRDCLSLFDGNVLRFFSTAERADFANFLDQDAGAWSYQVIERGNRVIACGGHALDAQGQTAYLCWGMVARELQGTGLGDMLTKARLRAAQNTPGVTQVRLDTSQHTQGFYRRFGFTVEKIVPDGYGPGLDRWDMLLCFCASE